MTLKISIVIPCLNAADYILKTLLSVQKQGYENLEVIVVDGKSSDTTLDVLSRVSGLNLRIVSEPDRGQLDALQKGLKLATGDILYWLNADDILMPGTLRFVERLFREDAGLDLVFSDDFAFEESKQVLSVGATIRNFTYMEHVLFYRQMYSECVFWRASRTRLLPDSYFHLRLCTDYAFFANLRCGLKEKWVRKRLGAFRIVPNQVSKRFADRLRTERDFIRTQIYERHGWTPAGILARRMAYAPRFLVVQCLYPALERGLRKLHRVLTGNRRRNAMAKRFFDVWLCEGPTQTEADILLMDH